MKILKTLGVIKDKDSKVLKLEKVKDSEGFISFVGYKDGMALREYPLTKEEFKALIEYGKEYFDIKDELKTESNSDKDEVVSWLVSTPSSDTNFRSALEKATADQLDEAIKQVTAKGGRNKTKLTVLKGQKDRLNPKSKAKAEAEKTSTESKVEEKKVIAFKSPKPTIIPLKTEGEATYGECVAKMKKESKEFTDSDSQYVIAALLELCKVDADFRNNLMREDKSYGGFMEYMANAVKNGYCINYGNVQWLSRDSGLELAIDYYNADTEKMKIKVENKTEIKDKKITKKKKGA